MARSWSGRPRRLTALVLCAVLPSLHDAQPPAGSARRARRVLTTLPADPVLQALGLPALPWQLDVDSVRSTLTGAGFAATAPPAASFTVTTSVATAPATVTFRLDRSYVPLLTGVEVVWEAPVSHVDAQARFNALLRQVDSATGVPHAVREGARTHRDTVVTMPAGRGLIGRHFVVWGLGRRLDAERTMTMQPDGTIRLQLGPNSILRDRAAADDHRELVMRYPAADGDEEADSDTLRSPAQLSQDLCTADLPYMKQVRGAPVTFHVTAEGEVRAVEAMYSLSFDERVKRTDIDQALLKWANTCRVIPAVASDRRVATTLRATLTGWLRGVGIR